MMVRACSCPDRGNMQLPYENAGPATPIAPVEDLAATDADEQAQTSEELERLQTMYEVLSKGSEVAVRSREPQHLYEGVCRILAQSGLCRMAWVGMVVPGNQAVMPVAHCGYDEGFLKSTRHSALEIPSGLGPTGTAIRENRPDFSRDIASDVRMSPWQKEALAREFGSCAAFPLRLGDQVVGALTVYGQGADSLDARLVQLIESLAEDMSFSIQSIEREGRRKRAEESLRRSEEYYRALIENAQDIITVINNVGIIMYMSPSVERQLGYKRSELRDRNVFEFLHPGDQARLLGVLKDVTDLPGSSKIAETRVRAKDGTYKYLDIAGKSFLDEAGVVGVVINARDVTDRKAVEEAQRSDRDFISTVIDTTAAVVLVFDQEGRIILFNSTAEQVSGYNASEVRGRNALMLVPEEDQEWATEAFKSLLSGDTKHKSLELKWVTKHGARKLVSWTNTVMDDETGAGGFVICTGIDITERRQAEEALKASEEQYRMVFESTGTAMCIINQEATVTFMNQEFERMSGYGAEEVEGTRPFTDFLVPEDVESFLSYFRETRRGSRRVPIHFECNIMDKAGNTMNVLANMGLLPASAACVVSLIDITKERTYENDLAETAERLKHFLSVASHELRHPITIVKGYANTLSGFMDDMPKEHVLEILEDIDSSADRLTRYVEELMDVSRVEEGRFPIEKKGVHTEDLLEMALEDMAVMGTNSTFSTTVAPEVAEVNVDPAKFVQLLVILLENAVKFGTPSAPIEIELSRNGSFLEGAVLDRGRGLAEDDRDKVFDRFYQVEDTMHHSTPGMGLGLYIAREIVTAHGGTIWCEPRDGGGTVFKFRLALSE
jgi:PAS domain S-box-containing protein